MIDFSQMATFYIGNEGIKTLYINGSKVWEKPTAVLNGLALTAQQANSTIKLTAVGTPDAISLEYSTNNGSTYSAYTVGDTITISSVGKKVLFRAGSGGNTTIGKDNNNYYKFVMSGKFNLDGTGFKYLLQQSGTISTIPSNYTFSNLFRDCESLVGNVVIEFPMVNNSFPQRLFYSTFRNSGIENISTGGNMEKSNTGLFNEICYYAGSLKKAVLNGVQDGAWAAFSGAFRDCASLEEVDFPDLTNFSGIQLVLWKAFDSSRMLKVFRMPKYASTGTPNSNCWDLSFNRCTSLELVDFSQAGTIPVIDSDTFSNTNSTFKVVVPDSLYSTWIAATNWSAISSHIIKKSDYDAL